MRESTVAEVMDGPVCSRDTPLQMRYCYPRVPVSGDWSVHRNRGRILLLSSMESLLSWICDMVQHLFLLVPWVSRPGNLFYAHGPGSVRQDPCTIRGNY